MDRDRRGDLAQLTADRLDLLALEKIDACAVAKLSSREGLGDPLSNERIDRSRSPTHTRLVV